MKYCMVPWHSDGIILWYFDIYHGTETSNGHASFSMANVKIIYSTESGVANDWYNDT